MKRKWIVMLAVIMLFAFTAGVVAAPAVQEITANLANDVKITLNGNAWTPKDADGSTMVPILYQGRTYLPVRAIGEALGVKVNWDNDTRTVILGEATVKPEPKKEEPKVEPKKEEPKVEPVKEEPKKEEPKKEEPKPANANDLVNAVVGNFSATNVKVNVAGKVAGLVPVSASGTAAIDQSGKASSKLTSEAGPLGKSDPTPDVCPYSEIIFGPAGDATAVVANGTLTDNKISIKGVLPASVITLLDNLNSKAKWSGVTGEAEITIENNKVTKITIKNGKAKVNVEVLGEKDAEFTADFVYTY
jgi:hypothetical protein